MAFGMEANLAVDFAHLPLLGQPGLGHLFDCPQAWAEQLNAWTPSHVCEPRARQGQFVNRMAMLPLGCMRILSTHGRAIQLESTGSGLAHMVMPYQGLTRWRVDRHWLDSWTHDSLLYVPPGPVQIENTVTAGVVTFVDPDALLQTARSMAGVHECDLMIKAILSSPKLIPLQGTCNQSLAKVLYSTYRNLDLLLSAGADALCHSRIDDQILRLWLLLLIPELKAADDCSSQVSLGESGSAWVKALASWIETHADQPLALSDLERQTGYSRRSLQLAFRTHMGCSPMQWVKRCRMQKARERLQCPAHGDSVASVAYGLGFVNLASFSRDYKRLFGERPSLVLRQARS
jgi:AraC-like DNA-binding protein